MRPGPPVALLMLAAALGGCQEADDSLPVPDFLSDAELHFLVLGDGGTGGERQREVAAAMAQVCQERGCDFVLYVGDVVYPDGVSGPDDPQFESKFEEPYAALDVPFYIALGNHDNGGGEGTGGGSLGLVYASGDHMVAYANRTDRASDKWTMPGRYYREDLGIVDLLALDTNTMVHGGRGVDAQGRLRVGEQEAWLPGAVASLNSTWSFAFGHHPFVSNGQHGDAGSYDGVPGGPLSGVHLRDQFQEHVCPNVDVYFAGHSHTLEWIGPEEACGMHQVVSGGGGAGLHGLEGPHATRFQAESYGFWWAAVTEDRLQLAAFDEEARFLFQGEVER